jgi:hypothetical protein
MQLKSGSIHLFYSTWWSLLSPPGGQCLSRIRLAEMCCKAVSKVEMLGMRQCALVLCTILLTSCTPTQCATASKITYNATGTSSLTPSALPLPSGSM